MKELPKAKQALQANIARQVPSVRSLSNYIADDRLTEGYERALTELHKQVSLDLPPENQKPLWIAIRDSVYYRDLILTSDYVDLERISRFDIFFA